MQQELGAREQTVAAMKASGDIPAAHLEELENTWDRVNHLADIREGRLRESLKLVSTVRYIAICELFEQCCGRIVYRKVC